MNNNFLLKSKSWFDIEIPANLDLKCELINLYLVDIESALGV